MCRVLDRTFERFAWLETCRRIGSRSVFGDDGVSVVLLIELSGIEATKTVSTLSPTSTIGVQKLLECMLNELVQARMNCR